MMHSFYDSDMYETVITTGPNWGCVGQRLRSPEEYARVRAERIRKEEDEILSRADAIRAARAATEKTGVTP